MRSLKTLRLLVIEDNDFMRDLVTKVLREIGIEDVFQAADGQIGLEMVANVTPDLILCDIAMEPMDGLSFVAALRKLPPTMGAKVPVIMLTGNNEAPTVKKAIDLGVNGYIVKPVRKQPLEARIVTVMRRANAGASTPSPVSEAPAVLFR